MPRWLQILLGRTSSQAGTTSARSIHSPGPKAPPPGQWDARLYRALHHHFYRSLISLRVKTSEDGAKPPVSQAGIDIEGLDPALAEIARTATRELDDPDQILKYMPRQPALLPRMVACLRDPRTSTDDLTAIIDQDPGFVARLLNVANSPFFRLTRKPIDDLHTAIVHLGLDGLQSLVNQCLLQPILSPGTVRIKGLSEKLYGHALNCAEIGQKTAKREGHPAPLAHLFGLLQALGDITLLTYLTRRFKLEEDDVGRVFRNLAPTRSVAITLIIVNRWEMGTELENALAALRDPAQELEGFSLLCVRVKAISMTDELLSQGIVPRANALRHAKRLGFKPDIFSADSTPRVAGAARRA